MGAFRRLRELFKARVRKPPTDAVPQQARGRKRKRDLRVPGAATEPVKPRKRQPGGAWRAFLREQLWGCKRMKPFKTLMPELRESYRNLPRAEKNALKAAGKAATRAAKGKALGSASAFGPRGRDVERKKAQAMHKSMLTLLANVDSEVEYNTVLADLRGKGSLLETMNLARMNRRLRSGAAFAVLKDESDTLMRWTSDNASTAAADFALAPLDASFVVTPVPADVGKAMMVALTSEDEVTDIANFVGHMAAHSGSHELLQSRLDDAFEALNSPVLEADCAPSPKVAPAAKYCRNLGYCICDAEGVQVHKFRTALHAALTKPHAKAHTPGRQEVKDGRWCLHLLAVRPLEDGEAGASVLGERLVLHSVYLHIAYQTLSPWKSAWNILVESTPPLGEPAADGQRIYLEVPPFIRFL